MNSIDYVLVALFGLLVGVGELVSRYRDAPWRAVGNYASAAYVSVNVGASVAALALLRAFGATFGAGSVTSQRGLQVLVAGFSAVAVLRTSLFVVRVGGRDVGVGPVTLLQVLLFATDRDVDRRRAAERAGVVTGALRGLTYEQAAEALPLYCLTLMQNVPESEESELHRRLADIKSSDMDDALKVNAVGLALMNVVGQRVLAAAADSARSRLLERGVLGAVYPRLYEVVGRTDRAEHRTLDVLGLTLYTAWPNVRAWLEEQPCPFRGWRIQLRLLDSGLLRHEQPQWFDPAWAAEAETIAADVQKYCAEHAELLRRERISLTISEYGMVPSVHGFRTGDGGYFISFIRWDADSGTLSRPHQTYEFLPPDDRSPRVVQYKELFDNWVARADGTSPPPNVVSPMDPGQRVDEWERVVDRGAPGSEAAAS